MKDENTEILRKVKYIPLKDKPAELVESKLFQDKFTFEVKLNIEFENISDKEISGVFVNLCGFDENVTLLFAKNIEFMDLSAEENECFQVETPVPSFKTSSVTITVNKVCFSDGTEWEAGQDFNKNSDDRVDEEIKIFSQDLPADKKLLFSDKERRVNEKRVQRLAEKKLWQEKDISPREIKKRKILKITTLTAVFIIIIAAATGIFMVHNHIKEQIGMFESAKVLYDEERYEEAAPLFESVKDLPEDKEYECRWYQALTAIKLENYTKALYHLSNMQGKFDSFTYMQQIQRLMTGVVSAGARHTVGLKKDGTVLSVGDNSLKQCETDEWTDIIAVSAGLNHSVGLKNDGTVVVTGDNEEKQCEVKKWKGIISVSAGANHTVGVMNNGRVVTAGSNESGQCETEKWSGIVAVSGGTNHTVGVRQDGTVVAVGDNSVGQCDVGEWADVVAVSAGNNYTLGLKNDGTVVATGDSVYNQTDVAGLSDIVLLEAGDFHGLFMTNTGRMKHVGDNDWHQGEGNLWKDLISLSGGVYHSVGICSDGTAYSAGENKNGQCLVSDWTDMGIPADAFKTTSIE